MHDGGLRRVHGARRDVQRLLCRDRRRLRRQRRPGPTRCIDAADAPSFRYGGRRRDSTPVASPQTEPEEDSGMTRPAGRIAVVNGAASGICKGISIAFAREGANVVIADKVAREQAGEVLAGIASHGREALFVQMDVSEERSVRSMAEGALVCFAVVDIFVIKAAV